MSPLSILLLLFTSTGHRFLDSLVVRISACHVEGPGSIPGRGEIFSFSTKSFSLSFSINKKLCCSRWGSNSQPRHNSLTVILSNHDDRRLAYSSQIQFLSKTLKIITNIETATLWFWKKIVPESAKVRHVCSGWMHLTLFWERSKWQWMIKKRLNTGSRHKESESEMKK